ncbi:MAG: hypothetical protein JW718_00310 [Desulfovibrionaceae bacterium]|nr:hypothetical protein [Desulfovibrionaceae bacterium]
MKRIAHLMFVLAALLLLAAQASASEPFTKAELDRFLVDLPAYVDLVRSEGERIENLEDPGTWEAARLGAAVTSFLESRDWVPERWAYVAAHVSQGLAVAQMKRHAPEMMSQMDAGRAQIMNNPYISAAQKQELMAQMQQSKAAVKSLGKDLPAEELALVKGNLDRIMKVYQDLD